MNRLIPIAVNLAGMLVIYSLLAFALVRLAWRRGGMLAVCGTIIIAGLFWIGPGMLAPERNFASASSFAFWFVNWLVSAFSVVLLSQAARSIPRQLEDAARMDGCGWFGTYWHVILPLVRQELVLLGFFTLLGTSLLSGAGLITASDQLGAWVAPLRFFASIVTGSILASLSVIVIFLFANREFFRGNDRGEFPSY
ncbi:MAG TPA: hypothetical protein VGI42_03370 [Chthoniobacterales bacterium]|jgi:multiple sugar transport system permease protein